MSKSKTAKTRKDSIETQSKILKEALYGIKPPAHLKIRKGDIPFWKAIIDARMEWTDVDLAHAANLARCQADIETNQKLLDKEGQVIKNDRGTPVMNPRFTILEMLSRRAITLASKIHVHAAATVGEVKASIPRNKAKKEAIDAFKANNQDEDSLIAKPLH